MPTSKCRRRYARIPPRFHVIGILAGRCDERTSRVVSIWHYDYYCVTRLAFVSQCMSVSVVYVCMLHMYMYTRVWVSRIETSVSGTYVYTYIRNHRATLRLYDFVAYKYTIYLHTHRDPCRRTRRALCRLTRSIVIATSRYECIRERKDYFCYCYCSFSFRCYASRSREVTIVTNACS